MFFDFLCVLKSTYFNQEDGMKANDRERDRLEEMRRRFRQCGIAVSDSQPEEDGGLVIRPNAELFACRGAVHCPGITRYNLHLRLLSDDPHRVIMGYSVTSSREEIRVLAPFEKVAWEYEEWDAEEEILNHHIGKAFGQTRYREGVLLAEGFCPPVICDQSNFATVTVSVWDQWDRCYSADIEVAVTGLDDLRSELQKPKKARKSIFEEPEDEVSLDRDAYRASLQATTSKKPKPSLGTQVKQAEQKLAAAPRSS